MKSKRILSFLLAFVMALALLPALTAPVKAAYEAYDTFMTGVTGGCYWKLVGNDLLLDGTRGMKLTV